MTNIILTYIYLNPYELNVVIYDTVNWEDTQTRGIFSTKKTNLLHIINKNL